MTETPNSLDNKNDYVRLGRYIKTHLSLAFVCWENTGDEMKKNEVLLGVKEKAEAW